MHRREVIKDLFLVAGAFVLAPSCRPKDNKAAITLKHMRITVDEEQLLSNIASAIIPRSDTPDAGELGCHLFTLKMLDDCYEKETQESFVKGLNALDAYAAQKFNNPFIKCTLQQQQQILNDAEEGKTDQKIIAAFYEVMKDRTIQGYLTSKYVLTNINKYEFIPSVKYNGYAPVTL
ncbi:MAG: gluconate 2-dehydrogenase subunit 3 family protein [Agriterribacter sp.]